VRKRDEGLATMVESRINTLDPGPSDPESGTAPGLEGLDTAPDEATLFTQQFGGAYILTPSQGGLMVIDQHRAHVRVLYDSYMNRASEEAFVAQATMFPDVLELSPRSHEVLTDISPRMRELGFVITHRGGTTWSIDGVPSLLKDTSPRALVEDLIESVVDTGQEVASTLHERLALSMARSGAIRRGRILSTAEMDRLIADLFRCTSPAMTPDGKNIFAIIPGDYFNRILG